MPATNALFTADELAGWLHMPAGSIAVEVADVVELVVWGWMKPALGVADRPAELSDEQKAKAIELAGIAYSNPEGLSQYALEAEQSTYDRRARADALDELAAGDGRVSGQPAKPRGKFPRRTSTDCYPDPAWPDGRGPWVNR